MISKEDMEKAARSEMDVFDAVEKEYPKLKKYKGKIYEQFLKHYDSIIELVLKAHNGKLYSHSLVINGAILRSLNYYRGAVWALGTRNSHVFFDSLRAQCESLSLIHYCVLKPEYVVAATTGNREHVEEKLKIKNILSLVDNTDKKYNGIRKDYDSLCELVHPNPASLYANIQPLTETEKGALMIQVSTKSARITEEDAELNLKVLICWTDWIFEEMRSLAEYFKKTIQ